MFSYCILSNYYCNFTANACDCEHVDDSLTFKNLSRAISFIENTHVSYKKKLCPVTDRGTPNHVQ